MSVDTTDQLESAKTEENRNTSESNLVQMRKMLETERSEKERLTLRNRQLEADRDRTAKVQTVEDPEDDDSDEPYVDPKTLKRKLAHLESKIEGIVERKAEEKARSLIDEDKKTSYLKHTSDFDNVMSPDMLQKFAEKCPGMAEAILKMPDTFDRQKLVYEAIKNSGVDTPEKPKQTIQEKIAANRTGAYYQPSNMGSAPYSQQGDFSATGQKAAYTKLQELKSRMRLG